MSTLTMRLIAMNHYVSVLFALLVWLIIWPTSNISASEYSVKDLLRPCQEGDNDSRGGVIDDLDCEQYINGVLDALNMTRDLKADGICLPQTTTRTDEVRRAFVKWVFDNFDQKTEPAAQGVLDSLHAAFPCQG